MSSSLTKADYSKILEYYGEQVPSSLAELKKSAEAILSLKLCRCIKKVSPENEPKAIGICTKNIFNKKGLTRGTFKCKNGRSVDFHKRAKFSETIKKKNKTIKRKKEQKEKDKK